MLESTYVILDADGFVSQCMMTLSPPQGAIEAPSSYASGAELFIKNVWFDGTDWHEAGVSPGPGYSLNRTTKTWFVDFPTARAAKREEVNKWRAAANSGSFTFAGRPVSVDDLSMKDIVSTNGKVIRTGTLPAGFPGVWKAEDNTYIPIETVQDWYALYDAMYDQGLSNFMRSEQLKAYIDDPARTMQEILDLTWTTSI